MPLMLTGLTPTGYNEYNIDYDIQAIARQANGAIRAVKSICKAIGALQSMH